MNYRIKDGKNKISSPELIFANYRAKTTALSHFFAKSTKYCTDQLKKQMVPVKKKHICT